MIICGVIVAIIAVGIGVFLFVVKQNKAKNTSEITIDNTANVITEINKLAEFNTAVYYQELVIRKQRNAAKEKETTSVFEKYKNKAKDYLGTTDEIVFIAKGVVRAGFDLSQLSDSNIVVMQDTIQITLPAAKIVDVISNPSDFETFVEQGQWTHQEVTEYKAEAREVLVKNAIADGLLDKATENGKESLTNLLKTMGFKEVKIIENKL